MGMIFDFEKNALHRFLIRAYDAAFNIHRIFWGGKQTQLSKLPFEELWNTLMDLNPNHFTGLLAVARQDWAAKCRGA